MQVPNWPLIITVPDRPFGPICGSGPLTGSAAEILEENHELHPLKGHVSHD